MTSKRRLLWATTFLAAITSGFAQPPIITNQPQSLTLRVGSTATFTVTATVTEPLAYQWQTKEDH